MSFNLTLYFHLYDMYYDKHTRDCSTKLCVDGLQLGQMPSLIIVVTLFVLAQLDTVW